MEEAPINENGDSFFVDYEIGFAWEIARLAPPTSNSVRLQQSRKAYFCGFVSGGVDRTHIFAAFLGWFLEYRKFHSKNSCA